MTVPPKDTCYLVDSDGRLYAKVKIQPRKRQAFPKIEMYR